MKGELFFPAGQRKKREHVLARPASGRLSGEEPQKGEGGAGCFQYESGEEAVLRSRSREARKKRELWVTRITSV